MLHSFRKIVALLLAGTAVTTPAVAQLTPAPAPAPSAETERATPLKGDLDPFKGDIDPFGGDINPFWGDIDPFYGDIDPFKGDIDPFWGTNSPVVRDVDPFDANPAWRTIGDFWRRMGDSWGKTAKLWDMAFANSDKAKLDDLSRSFNEVLNTSEAFWGNAVKVKTGKSFADGFAAPLLAKYGINRADAASIAKLSPVARNRFYLDWYDGLMAYSGADRVDHWMRTVNWSPAITQQQGSGLDTVIGLIDGDARGNRDIANNIVAFSGFSGTSGGHGAAVGSLLVSAHDGRGVMGIAPRARVVAYNPFDASGTAGWDEVTRGVATLVAQGASIINASLGVAGWTFNPNWRGALATPLVSPTLQMTSATASLSPAETLGRTSTGVVMGGFGAKLPVFVLAAGNAGATQTNNINWDFNFGPAFIVVGSVTPTGTISSFSNRPGTACLLDNGRCFEQNRLMNRFIVAPGELMLVSDGTTGGVTRMSGTSFAAPLVSGAIALLHDRWPWLARYPFETTDIVLRTAKDLGDKGVDPVYGVGLLDIERSQSPLNFNNLQIMQVQNGVATPVAAPQLLSGGIQTTWEADGVYFSLYETIGGTYRDFQIPMSSRLVGWVRSWSGKREHYQKFLTKQFGDWLGSGGKGKGFTDVETYQVGVGKLRVAIAAGAPFLRGQTGHLTAHSAITLSSEDSPFALTAGSGHGALAVGAQPGFARSADYASAGGGANPLLGLASGGAFAQGSFKLGRGTIGFGYTANKLVHSESDVFYGFEQRALRGFKPYEASAFNLHVSQALTDGITVSLDMARVREPNALFGVQSTLADDFARGSTTQAYSIGAEARLGGRLRLALTGTRGRTSTGRGQLLTTDGAIGTSAYAVSLEQRGVAGRDDLLRVGVNQPLHVERSALTLDAVEVVDRLSGDLGRLDRSFAIGGGARDYVGEVLYATPLLKGAGQFGLFAKGDLTSGADGIVDYATGVRFGLRF